MNGTALPLAFEAPVALHVDGTLLAVLMCTPVDLDELAYGHLLGRKIIAAAQDVRSLSICPDMRSVSIATFSGAGAQAASEGYVFSGCGAAAIPVQEGGCTPGMPQAFPVAALTAVEAWAKEMFAKAELYRKTGGMHVAALANDSQLIVREDVGRHNAVDKVIGRALLDGMDFSKSVLLTSGRIAADMVMKASAACIPVLVTRSIPTTEAYRLAMESGITLVGRILSANPIAYTFKDRITSKNTGDAAL
jgi:FdhD protein